MTINNNIISKSCEITVNNDLFLDDYIKLIKNEFSNEKEKFDYLQIKRLLESAGLLSLSTDNKHKQIASKISCYILNQYSHEYPALPFIVEIILTRLGDLPVIYSMIDNKKYVDYFKFFSPESTSIENIVEVITKFPEVFYKKITNQSEIQGKLLSFTDFQAEVFGFLTENKSVSFSAPTSGGKSYVVQNFICAQLLNNEKYSVVYVAPTKALIAEIQSSIKNILLSLKTDLFNVKITTAISDFNIDELNKTQKKVYILTQERLQEILSNKYEFNIDLLVVDEAQKIQDGSRGIILEDTIQELINLNVGAQSIFLSPYVSNPEQFSKIFSLEKEITVSKTSRTPVIQNILLVNMTPTKASLTMLLPEIFENENIVNPKVKINEYKIPDFKSTSIYKRKVWVYNNIINQNTPTLIYCNKPYDCRLVAEHIIKTGTRKIELTERTQEFIDFYSEFVHEEYYLVDVLKQRIGYHYGRMPKFVRFGVKQLFDEKEIDVICCTSTLLEGVNLPAKNIILHTPRAGGKELGRLSLLNLAGRAGRLLKDFYGNIYCININEWELGEDAFNDSLEEIQSAKEEIISQDYEDLLEYLKDRTYYCNEDIKGLGISLIIKQLKNETSDFIEDLGKRCEGFSDEKQLEIKKILLIIEKNLSSFDKKIMLRNRSIDPRNQYDLYKKLIEKGQARVIPAPYKYKKRRKDYEEILTKVFFLISRHLFNKKNKQYMYDAFIAAYWSTEASYKQLLEMKISRNKSEKKDKKFINKMIDEFDEELEQRIRYEYTRAVRCYIDIANNINKDQKTSEEMCLEFPMLLEAGASHKNTLYLMDLGLSRTTSTIITELIDEEVNSTYETYVWLTKNLKQVKRKLHKLLFMEFENALSKYSETVNNDALEVT